MPRHFLVLISFLDKLAKMCGYKDNFSTVSTKWWAGFDGCYKDKAGTNNPCDAPGFADLQLHFGLLGAYALPSI